MRPRSTLLVTSILALSVALWPLAALADVGGSDTGAFQRALSHGAVFALGASYVFGLATSLTPCVYPMIAITVSVFGAKEAKTRLEGTLLSLTFVLGIVCLFAPLGVVSALTGKGFGAALGNPWVVALIATVFVLLAASLFGAFEIALPPALQSRLSSVGGTGYRGALLLGLVCGLIAAPCVGPFLFGLLGWIATTRNVALGSAAMALYGLGLGTLFFVVGAFAVNLPKAGAWMMGIKMGRGGVSRVHGARLRAGRTPKGNPAQVLAPKLSVWSRGPCAPLSRPRSGRDSRCRGATPVHHRPDVQACEARVDRARHRRPFYGRHLVAASSVELDRGGGGDAGRRRSHRTSVGVKRERGRCPCRRRTQALAHRLRC